MPDRGFSSALKDLSVYTAAIERLAADPKRADPESLELYRSFIRRPKLARELATCVASGQFRFGLFRERCAQIAGKLRRLQTPDALDRVVLSVLAQKLTEKVEPVLSDHVYSYRLGRSGTTALRRFSAYIREHRAARPDPKARGLYVIRDDIRAYGESIPVNAQSPLWALLSDVLGSKHEDPILWELVAGALRPTIVNLNGTKERRDVGVPTGSPIQPVICNLYLTPVDRVLATIPGGFYARFGDDLLFAHPDPAVTRLALQQLSDKLRELQLTSKHDKSTVLYLTSAARPSSAWPEAEARQRVTYLGAQVDFHGQLGLTPEKFRALLRAVRRRIVHASPLLNSLPTHERLQCLCGIVNQALDPRCPTADSRAELLNTVVDDEHQLRELDYQIALMLAERVAARLGPKAFRSVPYQALRTQFGLSSLLHGHRIAKRERTKGRRPASCP